MSNLIETFGKILIECRNSGIGTFYQYKNKGWRPKKPSDEEVALIRLIESLDKNQSEDLIKAIRYCIDLSFFKLISSLEEGDADVSFDLAIKNQTNQLSLVNSNEDLGLKLKFWLWLKKYGK